MTLKIVDWILRILLCLGFGFASLGKLTAHPGVLEMFSHFGLPSGFHWLVGVVELSGAVLILIPKTRLWALSLLAAIVAGAAVMHALHDPLVELIRPGLFAMVLLVVWALRNQGKQ